MGWYPFDDGASIGQKGSEGGWILSDEEHDEGSRITLERDGKTAPFSITCGVSGWMVHTRFFGTEAEARGDFEAMKESLARIVEAIPLEADPEVESKLPAVYESIAEFVELFP